MPSANMLTAINDLVTVLFTFLTVGLPVLLVVGALGFLIARFFGALGDLGFRIPFVGWLWNAAVGLMLLPLRPLRSKIERITSSSVDAWLASRHAKSSDPLLRGDRKAFMQGWLPAERFPTLYMTIPQDVRRSVIWDGRLIGGYSVQWLAWRHVSGEVVAQLVKQGARIGIRAAAVTALILATIVLLTINAASSGVPYPEWSEGISIWPRVGWYVLTFADTVLYAVASIGLVLLASLFLLPALMLFAMARGFHAWWAKAGEALATPTRDSLIGWKSRADIREAEYEAYARQAKRAIDLRAEGQPVIPVGTAMGVLRARGDMEAPQRFQAVCLDGDSIRQHTLILGGTGAGKTRLAVRPLFNRIMAARWGADHRIGAYVTDGKGTLWRDLANSPAIAGRDDVVVVGTGDRQRAMDPLRGMSPLEVATTLKAVSGQVAGKPSDDFWPESASLLILHAATVAEVLDLDHATVSSPEWATARPWSLLGIGGLATSQKAMDMALARLTTLAQEDDANLPQRMAELLGSAALRASVEWLDGTWRGMAADTKSGIVANVNIILGKLGGAGELRERFCTGRYADTVDIRHALDGGIIMVAVGETEWGMVGKVISVWLKTRLYIEARKRLQSDPEACRRTSCAMFADEWQMLATTGPDSDATFWNVARETGVFLVAATQSLAALKQVLGDEATANIVNLLRTKVVLKTEEISTLDYCIKLAGETMRGIVTEEDFYETQGQRELNVPDEAPPVETDERLTFRRILPTVPRMTTSSARPIARLDLRFIPGFRSGGGQGPGNADTLSGARQAAFWRQEDKEKEAKGAGLQYRPKLTTDELLLGSGMAFAIVQRAGCDRSDIIDLEEVP